MSITDNATPAGFEVFRGSQNRKLRCTCIRLSTLRPCRAPLKIDRLLKALPWAVRQLADKLPFSAITTKPLLHLQNDLPRNEENLLFRLRSS